MLPFAAIHVQFFCSTARPHRATEAGKIVQVPLASDLVLDACLVRCRKRSA